MLESIGTLSDIRRVERIGWVMLGLPLLPIVALLSCALIARYEFGYFPSRGNPYPKDMGMGALQFYVLFGPLLTLYLWLLSLFSVIFLLASGLQRKRVLRNLVIVLLINAFYVAFMFGDPLGLGDWIAD